VFPVGRVRNSDVRSAPSAERTQLEFATTNSDRAKKNAHPAGKAGKFGHTDHLDHWVAGGSNNRCQRPTGRAANQLYSTAGEHRVTRPRSRLRPRFFEESLC